MSEKSVTTTTGAQPESTGGAPVIGKDALDANLQAAAAALPKVSAQVEAPRREKFNALLHQSSDGTAKGAVVNADGTYRRKAGRPPGSTKIASKSDPISPDVVADPAAAAEQRRARCEAKIRQAEKVTCAIIGDHAALDRPDREMLLEPLIECDRLDLFGPALDPRWSLAIVCGLLAIPRLLHPETIMNLRKFAAKFRRPRHSMNGDGAPEHTTRGMAAERES